jgi:hypothetical protein
MHRNLSGFQIQIYGRDGELSVYLITSAWNVGEATEQAERLVSCALPKAEVWSDGLLVGTVHVAGATRGSPTPKLPTASPEPKIP